MSSVSRVREHNAQGAVNPNLSFSNSPSSRSGSCSSAFTQPGCVVVAGCSQPLLLAGNGGFAVLVKGRSWDSDLCYILPWFPTHQQGRRGGGEACGASLVFLFFLIG